MQRYSQVPCATSEVPKQADRMATRAHELEAWEKSGGATAGVVAVGCGAVAAVVASGCPGAGGARGICAEASAGAGVGGVG